MDGSKRQPLVALLVFADSQARDLRRRSLPRRAAALLRLPDAGRIQPSIDVHWFTDRPVSAGARPGIRVHRQRGKDFAQRLVNAVDDLADRGYERIIIVGRDCPQLSADDIHRAADLLDDHRLVVGPDHRGGCWLIALHAHDRALLKRVRWQQNSDAQCLLMLFGAGQSIMLDVKFDLDGVDDLRLLARHMGRAAEILDLLPGPGGDSGDIWLPSVCRVRLAHQLPPPACPSLAA